VIRHVTFGYLISWWALVYIFQRLSYFRDGQSNRHFKFGG